MDNPQNQRIRCRVIVRFTKKSVGGLVLLTISYSIVLRATIVR